jgi:tyrosyl-tRNA synthetase
MAERHNGLFYLIGKDMTFKEQALAQLAKIKKNTVDVIADEELVAKIEHSLATNTPLRVKAGFDPTAPDIHLGHCVLLTKLRQFQDLGHTVVFIVGDFTARIGDPTGRSETRPVLSEEKVLENAKTYTEQAFKILDIAKTEIVFNGTWFDKMGLKGMMDILARYTVARILERDDFSKRYEAGKPISMLEFLYPLMQGFDSVEVKSDVELGGTDQKFNLIVGRHLQESYGQRPQSVITLPLLVGLDGKNKMSKSLGNYIGVKEEPNQIFGKVMSLSDEMMYHYYEIFTDDDIATLRTKHPRDVKVALAKYFVAKFYDQAEADKAERYFIETFSKRNIETQDFETYVVPSTGEGILDIIVKSGKITSKNEARRLLQQGGVEFAGEKVKDDKTAIASEGVLKIGKKNFLKITTG